MRVRDMAEGLGDRRARAAAALILALLLVGLIAALLGLARADRRAAGAGTAPAGMPRGSAARATPPTPALTPMVYADLTPDAARADNRARPLAPGPLPRARAFLYAGTETDRRAARTCLAAAALYEAGDDRAGEAAVAQVVLNRLRHPAFPKTVCGVVFQGAERATGCQFTFACDGALARPPAPAAWMRALSVADAALSGGVAAAVGTATHYHADYVVPYWRDTLVKSAVLGAHIFYRWPGWWGTTPAFTGQPQPFERLDPRLVALAGPEPIALPADPALPPPPPLQSLRVEGVPPRALGGAIVRLKDEAAGQFVVQLDPGTPPARWAMTGFALCGERPDCLVLGWTDAASVPRALPVLPIAMRDIAFAYRRSSVTGQATPAWDCRRFPRAAPGQCLPGTAPSGGAARAG